MAVRGRNRDYEHIVFTRADGVTEIRIHCDGGPWIWPGYRPHLEFADAFREVTADPETRAVILTGTGDVFCGLKPMDGAAPPDPTRALAWDPSWRERSYPETWDEQWYGGPYPKRWDPAWWEGANVLTSFLDIDVPVVSVINGPAWVHSEMPLLADLVVAADTASFADHAHFARDFVPGDGVHLVWLHLLGTIRGKYFLLTGQTIGAHEARQLGVVSEVVPAADALARGWELARELAARPRPVLRYTRAALNIELRKLMGAALSHGLAVEGLGLYSKALDGPPAAGGPA